VGIVDTDFALADIDIRAPERLFQLLNQVAGRGGRERPGRVYIQTLQPDHPFFTHFMNQSNDRFSGEEMARREALKLPPFTRLASVILSSLDAHDVQMAALALKRTIPLHPECHVLGPVAAPLNPLRKRFRWRFLLKASRSFGLQSLLKTWLDKTPLKKTVRVDIDIDPYDFL
jgi:primosomal protein N' (replication factor Y)